MFSSLSADALKNRIHYAVKTGKILSIRRGLYAKEGFDPFEVANKIFTPSYISLETVLSKAGIVFQTYKTISAVSYLTRRVEVAGVDIFLPQYQKAPPSYGGDEWKSPQGFRNVVSV